MSMNNVLILGRDYGTLESIDAYKSFIWSDRYCDYGDFEVSLPGSDIQKDSLVAGNYIYSSKSNHLMILERFDLSTDVEDGDELLVSGRSLESILLRRVIWQKTVISGNLQNAIQRLLNENAINPTDSKRKIEGLIFKASTDPRITSLTVETQFFGETLYDAVRSLCSAEHLGFRITPDWDGGLIFELYVGNNRTYDQFDVSPVEFSNKFENLISSQYYEDTTGIITSVLVGGTMNETTGKPITAEVTLNNQSGLDRRETFLDATSLSRKGEDGKDISIDVYQSQLRAKGREALADTNVDIDSAFNGEIDISRQFVYGRDFYLGDIVVIEDHNGLSGNFRITEMTYSRDLTGEKYTPTFENVDEDDE